MRSSQDLTNDLAPSSWSWAARASTSMPALANCASTASQSPRSVGRQKSTEFAVLGEGFEGALRHGVHGEWRRQGLDVQDVRGLGVLCARAGPQQALRAGPSIVHPLPAWRAQ